MNAKFLLGSLVSLLVVVCTSAQPQPGTVLWTYELYASCAPALASDGTIYVGTYSGLQAITNAGTSGSNKWTFPASSVSGISIGLDGTIYLAHASQNFYAVNPDGSQKWIYTFESYGSWQPAIGHDETVYVVGDDRLYALSPDGAKKWSYQIWDHHGTPVIADDGTIYVRNNGSPPTFFAVNPTGTLKWSIQLEYGNLFEPGAAPAIGAGGTIYVGDQGLHAFKPDGTKQWSNYENGFFGPVISEAGDVYVNKASYSTLYALNPSGEYRWHLDFPPRCGFRYCLEPVTPAIDAAGNLYYSASNSIFAVTSDGQIEWVVTHPNPGNHPVLRMTSPVIAINGTIYASLTNTLLAIAGTNPPGNTPWPMFQQNARRTGKVEKPALLNSQRRIDANFQFQLYAQLGQTNIVETSTNLTSWTALMDVIVTNVPMDVVDLAASNSPTRFYRAMSP